MVRRSLDSGSAPSKSGVRLIMALLTAVFLLSCSLFSAANNPASNPSPPSAPIPTSLPPAPAQEGEPLEIDYIYTSNLITIIYPLYGSILDDFAIITVTNPADSPAQLIIQSEITSYTTPAIDTIQVEPGETLVVRQNPRLIPEAIDRLNAQKPAQFHLKVEQLESERQATILEETGETLIYARRDFPWSIPGFTDEEVYELLATMVTPNDPAVEELIRAAADYTESGIMWSGYGDQPNDEGGGVWDRLQAIWQAEEQNYNLTYVNTWVSFAPGSVQRIRLPAEVLEQRSGNCIELAMLYAAAAEALDLEAAIVIIPGHAYMGVRTDQENANYYFIETTMIGRASFSEAVDRASEEFQEALPHMDAEEESYGWIKIWDARQKGILPLPWK
jgi:transglutaminase-like putative cysteine protease